jgi:GTPase
MPKPIPSSRRDQQGAGDVALASTGATYLGIDRERAVLVGLDFSVRSRGKRISVLTATSGAMSLPSETPADPELTEPGLAELDQQISPSQFSHRPVSRRAVHSTALDAEESLAEFRELLISAGGAVAAELLQRRPKPDPATLIGSGKVEEIAGVAASTQADLVLFDHDLSPTQLRNLEAALPCRVLDRTQLILDIFARHARTREGQLQVELAQLEYMLPRLTGRGKSMSQLGGGIGTRGPGETQLETDRRRIQRRIDQLKIDLESVRRVRRQQRQRREAVSVPTLALVGYTNAGKSTLFNALTGAHVLSSSRMFATLDPKLRAIELPSRRRVLLSDTVGFIRNLPHTLVTSFRATLEEVEQAEILLHVRDAASTYGDEQKSQVEKVLGELKSLSKPRIEVLNKIDLLPSEQRLALLSRVNTEAESGSPHPDQGFVTRARLQPGRSMEQNKGASAPAVIHQPWNGSGSKAENAVAVSALTGEGLDAILNAIDAALHSDPMIEADLRIPQHEGAALAAIDAGMIVHSRQYEGNLVHLTVSGPASLIGRMRRFRVRTSV